MNILTINSGFSSFKFSLYCMGSTEHRLASGSAEGIGLGAGHIHIEHGEGVAPSEMPIDLLDHRTALKEIVGRMQRKESGPEVHDIGHQLVLADSASVKPNG